MNNFVKSLVKNLGVLLLLVGVLFLVLYAVAFEVQHNWVLVTALVLEFAGILAHVIINRWID